MNEDGLADIGFACTQRSSSAGGLVLAYGPAAIPTSEDADYRLGIESYYTGTALASGDLDGDGHLDVVIGGYGSLYSSGAWSYSGSVVVAHGGASTAATVTVPTIPATDADADGVASPADCDDTRADTFPGASDTCGDALDQDCDGADAHCAPLGDQDNSDFTMWFSGDGGGSMRRGFAADVDGDGQDDMVLADYSADRDSTYSVGGIGVVYGPVPRWTATWDQADVFVLGTESAGSLGVGLTHGDLDGDGVIDIVVGGTTSDLAASNAGHVAVVSGARWTTLGSFDDAWATLDGAKDDEIGSVLFAGDLDGDGLDELVVGSSGYGTKGGAVWVWSGVDGARTTADADTFLDGDTYNTYVDELVVADVDGDGHGDLLVGYPNITTSAGGAVDVFAGPINPGSFALSAGDAHWTSSTMAAVGKSIAAADVDGDGSTDVFVGGYNGYNTLRFGPLALATEDLSAGDSLTLNYGDTSSCGGTVGLIDIDGDGAVDILGHCRSELYGWYGPVDAHSTLDPAAPSFRVWESTLTTDGGAYSSGDLDGDGYTDILDDVGLYTDPYAIVVWGGVR